jgi:hypothetical protein
VEVAINGDENIPTCDELDENRKQDLYTTVLNKSEEDTIDTASDMKKKVLKYHQYQLMNVCI